ncbi:Ig-like domain-containing protein [Isosphaeraceae bacterium EP7]
MSSRRNPHRARIALESLEARRAPVADFALAIGLGVAHSESYVDLKINATAGDAAGNVVVVGSVLGTANFGTTASPLNLTNSGMRDGFAAKFSADGSLVWAKTLAGMTPSAFSQGSAVTLDAQGNFLISGVYNGSVDFDPGAGTHLMTTAADSYDAYVLKLTSSGAFAWSAVVAGTNGSYAYNQATSIAVDPATGDVAFAGSFTGQSGLMGATFDAGYRTEQFVARLGPDGQLRWAVSTAGSASSVAQATGLAFDGLGSVINVGFYAGTVDFDPGPGQVLLAGAGGRDAYVQKLDSLGNLLWVRGFGSTDFDQANAVAVDGANRVIVTGSFSGSVVFDPSSSASTLTSGGDFDGFVAVVGPTGSLSWVRQVQEQAGGSSGGLGLAVDAGGRIFVDGFFSGTANFNPAGAAVSRTSAGQYDVFLATYSGSGSLYGVLQAGGTGNDVAFGLGITPGGDAWIAGNYAGPAQFGGVGSLPAVGAVSVFLARVVQPIPPVAPLAPTLQPGSDSGSSNSDSITNVAQPVFDLAGIVAGNTASLMRDGLIVASRVGPGPLADPGPIADGVHQYSVNQTDPSGTAGASGPFVAVTYLGTKPAAPTSLTLLAIDDSATPGDSITNVAQPRLTGSAVTGLTVQIVDASLNIVATTVANSSGAYTARPVAALADGTYTLFARSVDIAGNQGRLSQAFSLTIKASLPATLGTPGLLAADDSGTVGDGITNVVQPRLTGSATAGTEVQLVDSAGSIIATGLASGSGVYTIRVPSPLINGTSTYRTRVVDAAGNLGVLSPSFSLVVLNGKPAAPLAPTLFPGDDSGVGGDGITNVVQPRLTGVVAGGLTVQLVDPARPDVVLGSTVADGSGVYLVRPAAPLPQGGNSLAVRVVDVAGNTSEVGARLSLTIMTAPPATPAAPTLFLADDTGIAGDGVTAVRRPRFAGLAAVGSSVELIDAQGLVIGSARASATDGSYVVQPWASLPLYASSVRVRATDLAGNPSAAGASFAVFVVGPTGDFDGDGKADLVTYRASSGVWTVGSSSGGPIQSFVWGAAGSGDIPMRGDLDRDGKAELLVYRPQTAQWFSRTTAANPMVNSLVWGVAGGDTRPVVGDFDGDGKGDIAVYSPSQATWTIRYSGGAAPASIVWGVAGGGDIPAAADFDGDGKADLAVYNPSTATWFVRYSGGAAPMSVVWGVAGGGDVPMPADFDGDGKADIAVYSPGSAAWFFRMSGGGLSSVIWGAAGSSDLPIVGDFDGDGKADIAVYRPQSAQWIIRQSLDGVVVRVFGVAGADLPAPNSSALATSSTSARAASSILAKAATIVSPPPPSSTTARTFAASAPSSSSRSTTVIPARPRVLRRQSSKPRAISGSSLAEIRTADGV